MPETVLVIGDKKKSSWSLRPWLFLRYHGVAFREVPVKLDQPDTHAQILKHAPSGKVPCLIHGGIKVWESLAICEQAVEFFKLRDGWPTEPEARAHARSVAMEMHAGFASLRAEFPFDATRVPQTKKPSAETAADIARIRQIWREARGKHAKEGEWLFGKFGIVDAMYAPIAVRFHKYGVTLDGPEKDYVKTVLAMPALREWLGAALLEAEVEDAAAPEPATPSRPAAPVAAAPVAAPHAPVRAAAAVPTTPAPSREPPAEPRRSQPQASPLQRAVSAAMGHPLDESEMPPSPAPAASPEVVARKAAEAAKGKAKGPDMPGPGRIVSKIIPS